MRTPHLNINKSPINYDTFHSILIISTWYSLALPSPVNTLSKTRASKLAKPIDSIHLSAVLSEEAGSTTLNLASQ
jgi:hypothetical protein